MTSLIDPELLDRFACEVKEHQGFEIQASTAGNLLLPRISTSCCKV
jgi:hypothetical protein